MATLRQAVRLLADTPGVMVTAVSPFYETPPWGKTDQPAFINGAVAVETELSGQELLDACLDIERRLGRVRHEKWGARTIDIDLALQPTERCDGTIDFAASLSDPAGFRPGTLAGPGTGPHPLRPVYR